jgi:hypothetical protein
VLGCKVGGAGDGGRWCWYWGREVGAAVLRMQGGGGDRGRGISPWLAVEIVRYRNK